MTELMIGLALVAITALWVLRSTVQAKKGRDRMERIPYPPNREIRRNQREGKVRS